MSTEQNKAIVRDYIEGMWNRRDFSVADKYIAPDLVGRGPTIPEDPTPGPEGSKAFVGEMLDAFPDVHCQIDRQEVDGDLVRTWMTFTGTNTGPLMGNPATGNSVTVQVLSLDRIAGGKIVDSEAQWDPNDMMRQLGLM